jgi:pyrophosphatase PpaX
MKEYGYYLFDADGTLIDTIELIYQCFQNTSRIIGKPPVERSMVMNHIGLTLRDQMTVYFGQLTDRQFEEFKKIHMDYQMSVYSKYLKIYDGVYETLAALKKSGKKCAVVTSRFKESLEIYLEDMKIVSFFDAIVTPELTKEHKPLAAPALKALELLGGGNRDALFIGDATFDIECGYNAGTDTAFVEWSINNKTSLRVQPTYYLKNIRDLFKFDK